MSTEGEFVCRADGCEKSYSSTHGRNSHEGQSHPDLVTEPWHDEDRLRELYVNQRLSAEAISNKLGCGRETVLKYLRKHGIEVRQAGSQYSTVAPLEVSHQGYEVWRNVTSTKKSGPDRYPVHRLLAIAEYGFDQVKGMSVHHRNGIPWDNRPSNIEPMPQSDHFEEHIYPESEYTEFDRRLLAALHDGTVEQTENLTTATGMSESNFYAITREYR